MILLKANNAQCNIVDPLPHFGLADGEEAKAWCILCCM